MAEQLAASDGERGACTQEVQLGLAQRTQEMDLVPATRSRLASTSGLLAASRLASVAPAMSRAWRLRAEAKPVASPASWGQAVGSAQPVEHDPRREAGDEGARARPLGDRREHEEQEDRKTQLEHPSALPRVVHRLMHETAVKTELCRPEEAECERDDALSPAGQLKSSRRARTVDPRAPGQRSLAAPGAAISAGN
jgi:hypothetical protein